MDNLERIFLHVEKWEWKFILFIITTRFMLIFISQSSPFYRVQTKKGVERIKVREAFCHIQVQCSSMITIVCSGIISLTLWIKKDKLGCYEIMDGTLGLIKLKALSKSHFQYP